MTPSAPRCLLLPWDSEFFGVRIARIVAPRLDSAQWAAASQWCATENIDCLYWLADPTDGNAHLAKSIGLTKVDERVFLRKILVAPLEPITIPDVRLCEPDDVVHLKEIAAASHADSRFHHDGGFAPARCTRLYETHVVHDCAGGADAVWVATRDGLPVGSISCHLRPGRIGEIGLFAVAPEHRGQGIGRSLLQHALHYFGERGVSEVGITANSRSHIGRQLAERFGFAVTSVQWWYHRWFRREALAA